MNIKISSSAPENILIPHKNKVLPLEFTLQENILYFKNSQINSDKNKPKIDQKISYCEITSALFNNLQKNELHTLLSEFINLFKL